MRYENRYFQMERSSDYPPRQAKVSVCEWEDERIEIRYQGKARPHREIEAPEAKPPTPIRVEEKRPARRSPWKPPASHPWRRAGRAAAAMRRAMRIGDIFNELRKGTFLTRVDRVYPTVLRTDRLMLQLVLPLPRLKCCFFTGSANGGSLQPAGVAGAFREIRTR